MNNESTAVAIRSFVVNPLTSLEGVAENFKNESEYLQGIVLDIKRNDGAQIVELIECEAYWKDDIRKDVDERGYIFAPRPYLLGLGVQHPQAVESEDNIIISLDKENGTCNDRYHLSLFGHSLGEGDTATPITTSLGKIFFAVIRKKTAQS